MDDIGSVGTSSRYERYQQRMQTFNEPIRKEPGQSASTGASEQGIGFGAQAQPAAEPSLLVAVQEAGFGRRPDDEEGEGRTGLFGFEEEDEQSNLIAEILEVGFVDWAHEQWLEKIREKARQTALASLGMTEDDLAKMAPEMSEQIERMIEEMVEAAIRSATEEAAEKKESDQASNAMVLNPIITGG
ncbi:MAG: hypothetical protein ISR47_09585 [Rhodospirillales bacterium]|nr:hypothetical protein [Rhodospirillales bacterium]